MAGSVVHSIEAQKYTQERSSLGDLAHVSNSRSDESAITARSNSDFTVNLSEEAKNLLNEEQNIQETDSDIKDTQSSSTELTEEEQTEVEQLEARDEEVRTHEQAHAAAGGQYAGSPSYSYEQGPDGKRYITDGEVQIDVSPISGDPQATIEKMKQVYRAALAPAEPSSADRAVAQEAQANIAEASAEKAKETSTNQDPSQPTDFNSLLTKQPLSILESRSGKLERQHISVYA